MINPNRASPITAGNPGFIYNLQATRAYASVWVVIVHLIFWEPDKRVGSFGVDLFFVLSGFVMTHICWISPDQFMRRRLIRVVPMYWLFTVLLFGLAFAPAMLNTTRPNFEHLVKSLFFIPFEKVPGMVRPVLPVGWTLNYEMFFYLVFGGAILADLRRAPVIAGGCLALLPIFRWFLPPSWTLAGYYTDPVMLEFVYGIIIAYLIRRKKFDGIQVWHWMALGVTVIILPLSERFYSLPYRFLNLGLPAAVLIYLAVRMEFEGAAIKTRWVRHLGDSSYSLYLSHAFVLRFGEKLFRMDPLKPTHLLLAGSLLLTVASVFVGLLVHDYIELPTQRWMRQQFGGRLANSRMS